MEMLKLALKSELPLIHVQTDDLVNIQRVLKHLNENKEVQAIQVPELIVKLSDIKVPDGECRVYYTANECKSMVKLYTWCLQHEKTIVFVNTEKSKVQFDGGQMVPTQSLMQEFLLEFTEDENLVSELLPSFGGLTLKDAGEVARMTMTRDGSLTSRGVNETRRGYRKLRGITQVDTDTAFYDPPAKLNSWLSSNTEFFLNPVHHSLVPRGLLFDGPPGTGKTLGAKYIAQSFGVPLYRLDLGGVMGKYVGESEGNLLAALAQVDEVEPCVIVLDEVEKVFKSSSDSGVTSRLLSQLLWWLQEHKSKVFTVMTTNDLMAIPKELYREGRIDATMQFLGIQGYDACMKFAVGAFDSMLAELSSSAEPEDYKHLGQRIMGLCSDDDCVPQSKLTQVAYAFVRELLSSNDKAAAVLKEAKTSSKE